MVVLLLRFVSCVVPNPRNDRTGFKAGGLSVGVETQHEGKVSPFVSAVMILSGAGMMVAGKMRCSTGLCGAVRGAGLDCQFLHVA
jgi:hypothetical protein